MCGLDIGYVQTLLNSAVFITFKRNIQLSLFWPINWKKYSPVFGAKCRHMPAPYHLCFYKLLRELGGI